MGEERSRNKIRYYYRYRPLVPWHTRAGSSRGAPGPGLIDAHVHIESSLLVPPEYARLVASHGTTTVIADPHEIANVAGIRGIEYMLACRTRRPGGHPVHAAILRPGKSPGHWRCVTRC